MQRRDSRGRFMRGSARKTTTRRRRPAQNRYIKKRGDRWVIVQKGTGRVLSRHSTKAKAQASFRAMEWRKHRAR